jgi:hypothetical protein
MNAFIFPIIDFNEIDITKIPSGSFVIAFDLNSGGKLSKIDELGTVQVIEGAGGGGGPETDPVFTAWLGTNPLSGFATTLEVSQKQDTLVSGTNIKTINGESILGSGNILVSAGGERRHDFDSGYSYCGTAPLGSLESQEIWTIKRLTIPTSGENIVVEEASLVRWTDRLIVSYS